MGRRRCKWPSWSGLLCQAPFRTYPWHKLVIEIWLRKRKLVRDLSPFLQYTPIQDSIYQLLRKYKPWRGWVLFSSPQNVWSKLFNPAEERSWIPYMVFFSKFMSYSAFSNSDNVWPELGGGDGTDMFEGGHVNSSESLLSSFKIGYRSHLLFASVLMNDNLSLASPNDLTFLMFPTYLIRSDP